MKKLMSILGTLSVIASSSTAVVACGDSRDVIQLIVPEDPNAFWNELISTAENYVKTDTYKDKYTVKWTSSKQDSNNELKNTQSAIDGGAKAVIMGQNNPDQRAAAKYVVQNDVPLIAVNIPFADDCVDGEKPNFEVFQDAVEASKTMAEKIAKTLADNGVKDTDGKYKVYEIWGDPSTPTAKGRHKGFAESGKFDYSWFKNNDSQLDGGKGVDGQYLETKANELTTDHQAEIIAGADLIYAHSDSMARGALTALGKSTEGKNWLKPTVAGDGAIKLGGIIVGYDYDSLSIDQIAAWKTKPEENIFASIHMSAKELAEKSMKRAIEEIENSNQNKNKHTKEKIGVAVITALDPKS
ncbi:lipoprotein (VslE) [Spiroplasma clarkii]|uniref:Ribose ABC transporter substrate-binding protein n=1 Tax=Spiroplasma clarkii TaxID=2139 RepID=A0A1Y0KZV2_9MOLU|nr:lipoprotein [Spiroplasma clarkii]ARU90998.1 lipoprotein (VslE) [Spiroplasma clarkii]ATX70443.1 ribose ABC transporter substrate-binding protein [Spiroplasma clarkii]